jgi:glycosyltransferase involved in cell wall biosynthesis
VSSFFKNKTICFFTNSVNISFVANEIEALSERFADVYIVTFSEKEGATFKPNVHLLQLDYKNYSTLKIISKHKLQVLNIIFNEFIKFPKYVFYFGEFIKQISYLLRCFYLCDIIESKKELIKEGNLFYTFWFNDWATVLAILKKNKKIDKFYSRAHGTDLFENRVPRTKRIAFRWFQLKYVTKVFSVSRKGADYLKIKYPFYAKKIDTVYLGTQTPHSPSSCSENKFTILTCARIRNIKRIHLIPEILMHIDFPLKWIHIGAENKDDVTLELLHTNLNKLKSQNKNIEVVFLGDLTNDEVFEIYQKNYIRFFVSVSETEGLPVSMMEAISFGVPVLATDVGGCGEIVTEQTGVLVSVNFDCKEVAYILIKENSEGKFINETRIKIKEFWHEKFCAEKNMDFLLEQLN